MKQKGTDFEKLNRLLVASFEAEKLYYNAAQDAQSTDLKRFLNYMATERNRMSHDISNELHSRDIEPLKEDAEKGNIDRSWHEIKDALEHFDANVIINQCVMRDENNLKRYEALIESNSLPESIIALLVRQKKKIEWYIKQAQQHKNTHFVKEQEKSKQREEEEKKRLNQTKKGDDDKDKGNDKIINLRAI